jgi:G3E family GTPase
MSGLKSKLKDFSIKDGDVIPKLVSSLDDIKEDVQDNVDIVSKEKIQSCNTQLSTELLNVNPDKKLPITIITGFLGSGKSTMLNYLTNHLVQNKQDLKIAVIMNEFGDTLDIEKSITIYDDKNKDNAVEWLDLGNGCICCSVKDAGVKAIEDLVKRQSGFIDYIILETSGMADPTNLAKMFWLDDSLMSNIRLDGIITVLDGINMKSLVNEQALNEISYDIITKQIAIADKIILNKVDKLNIGDLEMVKTYVKNINDNCEVLPTTYGKIENVKDILFLNGYSSFESLPDSLNENTAKDDKTLVKTIKIDIPTIKSQQMYDNLKEYLQKIHWQDFGYNYKSTMNNTYGDILRTKGLIVLHIDDKECKVIQGVRDTFEIIDTSQEPFKNTTKGKLVLIGQNLNKELMIKELNAIFEADVIESAHIHDDQCGH